MKYIPKYRPEFRENILRYANLRKRIEKKCLAIAEDPYHNTEPLEDRGDANLKGIRSKRIDRNFRILFAICEECKRMFTELGDVLPCRYCDEELPGNTVIFFAVGPHESIYKHGRPLV